MTAIVRVFAYSELITAPVASSGGRFASDSVGLLKQPHLASEKLTVADTPLTTAEATATSATKLLFVQVQFGKAVHYQISSQNIDVVTATDSSPVMSGDTVLNFGPGWRVSFLECTDA